MKLIYHFLSILILINTYLSANISGLVYQDLPVNENALNTYGLHEVNELGVSGVTVTAYFNSPTQTKTTQTLADGSWDLNVTATARIEFSNWPLYLQVSPNNKVNNASIRFASNGDTINLGLHNPDDYTNSLNDKLIISLQNNGTHLNNQNSILKIVPPSTRSQDNSILNIIDIANAEQMGSIWGVAYDKLNKIIYTSAMLRRHISVGDQGLGAIYKIDINNTNNPILSHFTTVNNVGANLVPVDRNLSTNNIPSHDPIFEQIAKIGLGDLDIDENNQVLYTININNNTLVKIDINNSINQTTYPIGNPFNGCTSVKSWGVSVHKNKVYVGSVCTNDLSKGAAVSLFNGLTFTTFHLIPLTMDGEQGNFVNGIRQRWNTWEDDYNNIFDGVGTRIDKAQPILSDISFKENDDIIVGFIDRTAFQTGHRNYSPSPVDLNNYAADAAGDFYYVCQNNGQYYNEGTVQCPYNTDTFRNQDSEFFIGEEYFYDNIRPVHEEVSLGGLAYQAGSNKLTGTVYNPIDRNRQNGQAFSGITWLNTSTGAKTGSKRVVNTSNYMGKTGGVGDIEILKSVAPIEIGDRVWFDKNGNGIQDANESGIDRVQVKLFQNNIELAIAYTNPNGIYIFSNDPSGVSTDSHIYNISALNSNQNYKIVVPNIMGSSKQTPLNALSLTIPNSTMTTASNNNDSDANITGNDALIQINHHEIPYPGANNHSFDIGFKSIPTYSLGDTVWLDSSGNGIHDSNELGVPNVRVDLYNNATCTGVISQSDITDTNGSYLFVGLNSLTVYCLHINLPNDHNVTLRNQGTNPAEDSDANATAQIPNINLVANNLNTDIGIVNTSSIVSTYSLGDTVWLDSSMDGIYDANESGVPNVRVDLYTNATCTGGVSQSDTTDVNGTYLFTDLNSTTTYCLEVNLPNDRNITLRNQGTNPAKDSDADANAQIQNINLLANDLNEDIGIVDTSIAVVIPPVVSTYSLGDTVWLDSSMDGIYDANESGVPNVRVDLYTNATCTGGVSQSDTTDVNGTYLFTDLNSTTTYCLEVNLPNDRNITLRNQGTNPAKDSDADANAQIQNINLLANDLNEDIGIVDISTGGGSTGGGSTGGGSTGGGSTGGGSTGGGSTGGGSTGGGSTSSTVVIGNRIWVENDNDGNQNTGIVTGLSGITVTARASDGTEYTAITDDNGIYAINVPENDTYIVTFNTPSGHIPTTSLDNVNGIEVEINTVDNLTIDFGFRATATLGVTTCEEMLLNDDTQNANESNATTTIDVLSNDIGTKSNQEIKFLSLDDGKRLWENKEKNITNVTTMDILIVEGEGTWSVVNNEIVFTALPSFDGQVPSPIYYIVEGNDCSETTRFSNVAKIEITTPCTCLPYESKSVGIFNLFSILILLSLTLGVSAFSFKERV